MGDRWAKAEQFKTFVKEFFEDPKCEKTGWGKLEVAKKIEELWSNFLLRHIE